MSLKINADKFIGIVGRSGGGKSTLMQLLLRFTGKKAALSFINNQDITLSNPAEIRKLIAYVPQKLTFFPAL